MSKNKLAKFAEMASYDHVIEAPFQTPDTPYHPLRGKWHAEFFKNYNPIVLVLNLSTNSLLPTKYLKCGSLSPIHR